MPRITTFDLSRGLPGGELSVRPDPADFGLAGESVTEAAGALTDLGQALSARQAEAARAQRLNEAVFGAVRDLSDLRAGLADDAEPETLAERFASEAEAIAGRHRAALAGDPALERAFGSLTEPLLARGTIAARTEAAKGQAARFRATLESGLSELAARTAGAPDGLTRDLLGRQAAPLIRAGWDAGLIEEGEAATYARRFRLGVDQAEASLLVASDPAAALSRLADPRDFPALDAPARAALTARAGARAAALPADERAAQARAGLAADIAAEQTRVQTTARLFSGIDGGTAGLADIEDAAATGEITASDRGVLMAALYARRARDERDAEHIARVGAALRGDAPPLDPSHQADRAAADAYYARVLAPALMNAPSDTGGADRQIADFAARTGIVPSAVVARARAEMTFGTLAEQARAARLVAALPENLRAQAGADLAARAAVLAPLLDSGLPPELALRVADSGIQQRAQGAQQRLDRTKDGAVPPLGNRSDIAGTEGGADNGNINFYGHVGNDSARPTEPKKATRPNGWFQNYLVESMEALERMPGDIVGMARDLVTEPGEFLKQSAPAVVGLGLAMPIARASAAATESEDLSALTSRAKEIHNLLDHVARKQRVTAVLSTDGDTIVASGGRDLAPLQINSLRPGEVLAKLPGTHAEITALSKAQEAGVVPRVLVTTRPICPACATAIKSMGGQLIDETTAIFPR